MVRKALESWTCVSFCRACTPYAPNRHITSQFRRESAAPSLEPLHLIVMSGRVVTVLTSTDIPDLPAPGTVTTVTVVTAVTDRRGARARALGRRS
jgi:hypothetical protein